MLAVASILAFAAIPTAMAHGGVLAYSWGGQWYQGWAPYNSPTGQTTIQRPWSTYNPIQDATDPTISCNDDGTAGALQLTGTVAAGTAITAYWNQVWPHAIGPMLTYLANCGGDCTSVNSDTLSWFKIDEAGLLSGSVGSGSWADGEMIADNSSWTTTIPSCVPAGNYLIRFETIALHSQPAQFYPECAQIKITGGGSQVPTNTVKFPGGYSNSDPGIDINVYSSTADSTYTYTIPGPPLYTCGGSSPASSAKPVSSTSKSSSSIKTTSTSSVKTTSTSSSKTTSTSAGGGGGTVAHYGQCGGSGYSGPTVCASPYTCTVSNQYYSQCL